MANMEFNDSDIDDYTLDELDTEAEKLQNARKCTRDELDESTCIKQLTHMKKKQKVVQIRRSTAELAEAIDCQEPRPD